MDYFLKTEGNFQLPEDSEYIKCINDILLSESFRSMDKFIQHGNTTCLEHSVNVSYYSYLFCKKHGLNARSVARAGLLHDMFLYDWHLSPRKKGEWMHGFEHPKKALLNAEREFSLTEMERNIILRHMWPLTLTPPRYKEAYVVVWYDKACSMRETLYLPMPQIKSLCDKT